MAGTSARSCPTRLRSISDQAINIYFFVPEFDYAGPPTGFDYTIKSLGRTLEMRRPPSMAN